MRQNYSDDIQKQYYKITDDRGKTIFVINSILFKGKRRINWDDVEEYLKNIGLMLKKDGIAI